MAFEQWEEFEPIEVTGTQGGSIGSFHAATFLSHVGRLHARVLFTNLKDSSGELVIETVSLSTIRPVQPIQLVDFYIEDEDVDIWLCDGWWHGNVVSHGDDDIVVAFDMYDGEYEVTHMELRPHAEHIGGWWQFAATFRQVVPEVVLPPLEQVFTTGLRVEVIGTEEGDLGSYMNGIVVGFDHSNFYPRVRCIGFVEDLDEVTDNYWEGLTHPCMVRPAAPIGVMESYDVGEEVNVDRGNDRYWYGTVVDRQDSQFLIRYDFYHEDEWVQVSNMRPHGDWDYMYGWVYLAKYEDLIP